MRRNDRRTFKNQKDKFKTLGIYIIVVLFIFVLFIIVTSREVMLKVNQPVQSATYMEELNNTEKLVGNMLKAQNNKTQNKEADEKKANIKEIENKDKEIKKEEMQYNEVENDEMKNDEIENDEMNNINNVVNVNIKDIIWPLKGVVIRNVGVSYSKTFGDYRYHDGIDIKAERGAEVVATLSGKVINRETTQSEGIKITIDHGQGWVSMYKHLGGSDLKLEGKIKIGEKVGIINQPGLSEAMEGIHLHYCLLKDDIVQNPLEYLSTIPR
ncbi:MAG: M23 family metallopeptidase [Clostridia bacterium]|nr:M23 family metallopeptidase [Clostridia bacterium]